MPSIVDSIKDRWQKFKDAGKPKEGSEREIKSRPARVDLSRAMPSKPRRGSGSPRMKRRIRRSAR